LWKVAYTLPTAMPSVPATMVLGYIIYEMISGGYFASAYLQRDRQVDFKVPLPDRMFTSESLAGEGVR